MLKLQALVVLFSTTFAVHDGKSTDLMRVRERVPGTGWKGRNFSHTSALIKARLRESLADPGIRRFLLSVGKWKQRCLQTLSLTSSRLTAHWMQRSLPWTTLTDELKGARKEREELAKRERELQAKLDKEREEGAQRVDNVTSHFKSLIESLVKSGEMNATMQAKMMTTLDNELKNAQRERDEGAKREKELQAKLDKEHDEGLQREKELQGILRSGEELKTALQKSSMSEEVIALALQELQAKLDKEHKVGARRQRTLMLVVGFLSCSMTLLHTTNAALKLPFLHTTNAASEAKAHTAKSNQRASASPPWKSWIEDIWPGVSLPRSADEVVNVVIHNK